MHRSKRLRKFRDGELTGRSVNTAVFGLLERHSEKGKSKVRAKVNPTAWRDDVRETIRMTAEQGTSVYSDEHGAYRGLETEGFRHDFVQHAEFYVKGAVHTNGIENFWSLFKRGIKGTYISVEPFHMFRYIDEQAFRFNTREGDDADRFITAMNEVVGKRVTYAKLTGKEDVRPSVNGEGSVNPKP